MYKTFIKRVLDIIGGLILLPFIIMIIVLVGIMIKLEDRGPVFYNAPRLGMNGNTFKMYKFRSMKVNAPDIRNKDGSTYNSDDDPRLTKVGKLLRKTSIDEVVQVLNVLKGDMSFIGPRPDLPSALSKYSSEQKKKLQVRPGITGYNQAYYRNSVKSSQKYKNDIFYLNNLSFILDIRVFFKTIASILFRKNVFNSKQ